MTGTAAEIALLDATDQADLVRDGEVSTTALVEVAIERIEQLNPVLGAVVTTLHDQARTGVAVGLPQPGGPAAFHLRIERRVCSRRRRAAGAHGARQQPRWFASPAADFPRAGARSTASASIRSSTSARPHSARAT